MSQAVGRDLSFMPNDERGGILLRALLGLHTQAEVRRARRAYYLGVRPWPR